MIINPESMIKAKIAETIIEEMFRRAGYQVYRFGFEPVLLNLMRSKEKIDTSEPVGQAVATMPDLLVIKDRLPNFIEVKFRKDGKLNPSNVRYWPDGWVVLVFPFYPYFRIAKMNEFIERKQMNDLEKDRYFNIPSYVMERFLPLVRKYLKDK
jgi:hypothetical protein